MRSDRVLVYKLRRTQGQLFFSTDISHSLVQDGAIPMGCGWFQAAAGKVWTFEFQGLRCRR
jgi:hypothetical protein